MFKNQNKQSTNTYGQHFELTFVATLSRASANVKKQESSTPTKSPSQTDDDIKSRVKYIVNWIQSNIGSKIKKERQEIHYMKHFILIIYKP